MTSRYIHTVDTAPIMAADNTAGYIQALADGTTFQYTSYALDRKSRKASLANFLGRSNPAVDKSDNIAISQA